MRWQRSADSASTVIVRVNFSVWARRAPAFVASMSVLWQAWCLLALVVVN